MHSYQTLGAALQNITERLNKSSETPHLDAELLLSKAILQTREYILIHPEKELTLAQITELEKFTQRRVAGEPIAYILGHKEFWSLDLEVNKDVLIPRPETEHLIEWALEHLPKKESLFVADLGVGSGAIAIALAKEFPQWHIHGTENNQRALAMAKRNTEHHHITNLDFFLGHWCQPLPRKDYAAILSNPPYIADHDPHLLNLKFEPQSALNGGKEGLAAFQEIIPEAKNYLRPNGYLILEHGYDQRDKVIHLMSQSGFKNIQDHKDLAGQPRFVTGCMI